ncbi:MAG TPA: Gfo/Idh/MocA family oxidoreductase [Terracidiphilus sp.]|jgi:predicted dehydrogenase
MIRYGLLGFGHHCEKRLIAAFPGAHASVLAGLWRRDLRKAAANARAYSIEHVFATAEELCAAPAIDAVFVTSPDALHLPHVLLALAHGKPVLCEKPLGMRAEEVKQMLAAAKAAGQCLGVAQNLRYNKSLEVMRDWIAEGRIGRPLLAHSQFCYAAETSPRQWIYDPALACGGPIGDVGIHCIDALRFVLGSRVAAVNTLARADERSGALEAYAAIGLDFSGSAVGTVTVSTRGAYRSLIEVTGETGAIVSENGLTVDSDVDVLLWHAGKTAERKTVSNGNGYTLMLDSFSNWVRGLGEYRATGEDGLHNQQVLDAAYSSWHTGERQTLPPA